MFSGQPGSPGSDVGDGITPGEPRLRWGDGVTPGEPWLRWGVASLPGSSAQCTTSRNTRVPQRDPCTGGRAPCSPAWFQADPVWCSPADSPSVSWEMRHKCALWGGPAESPPDWMSTSGSPHWRHCRHRRALCGAAPGWERVVNWNPLFTPS